MGRTLQVLAAGILVSLAATAALAGTADDPEIQDPNGDAGDSAIDVTDGWVNNTTSRILFNIMVQNQQDPDTGETHFFCWTFRHGATEYTAQARVSNEDPLTGIEEAYNLVDGCQGQSSNTLTGSRSQGVVTIRVPREVAGSPQPNATLEDNYIRTVVDGDPTNPSDRAPDGNTFGDAYTFPAGPAPDGGNGGGPGTNDGDVGTVGPGILAGAGLLVVLAAGGGYYLWTNRSPKLSLDCPDPERVAHPGQGTNFPVRIENHGAEDVNAELEAQGVPEGWVAFVPLPTMELEAGEAKELWVTVKPPGDAEIGATIEVDLVARIRGQESSTRKITMRTVVEETGPEATV